MKCTVVSLCPFPIDERKPGLNPSIYQIPAANLAMQSPEVLIVDDGHYFTYLDHERGSVKQIAIGEEIAKAICLDYQVAQIGYNDSGECQPALFWVKGEYSRDEVKKQFKNEIAKAMKAQSNWFLRLIKMADDDWQKHKKHAAISDKQRFAAKALGFQRDWLIEVDESGLSAVKCPACDTTISGSAAICKFCNTIVNKAKYDSFQRAEAR